MLRRSAGCGETKKAAVATPRRPFVFLSAGTAARIPATVRNARWRALSAVGGAAHALGHDADFFDAGALRSVDHEDDVGVAQVTVTDDEHRLVLALLEDRAEALGQLLRRDVLLVD